MRVKTTLDYIRSTWVPLYDIFGGQPIFSYDPEEITELLETRLALSLGLENRQRMAINRFFREMHTFYEIPLIAVQAAMEPPVVDANVFTEKEFARALSNLQYWKRSQDITPMNSSILSTAERVLDIYALTGLRRNELLGAKHKDLLVTEDTTHLIIRPHKSRGLKTRNSKRAILLPMNLVKFDSTKPKTDPLFPLFSNPLATGLTTNVITDSLRQASGRPQARIHWCRHTVGTLGLFSSLNIDCPLTRLVNLLKLSAHLGHGSPSTTVSYYGHSVQHAVATNFIPGISMLNSSQVSSILDEPSSSNQRQRRKRALTKNRNEECFITALAPQDKSRNKEKVKIKGNFQKPPSYLFQESKQHSFRDSAIWLLDYLNGYCSFDCARDLGFSEQAIAKLMTAIIKINELTSFTYINTERTTLDLLELSDSYYTKAPTYRLIPQWLSGYVRNVSTTSHEDSDNDSVFLLLKVLRSRKSLEIKHQNDRQHELTSIFDFYSLPLILTQSDKHNDQFIIQIPSKVDSKNHDYGVRILVYFLLIYLV